MWNPRQNVKDDPRQTGQVALGGRHWLPRLLFCGVVLAVLVGFFWWQQNGLSSETLSVPAAPDGFAGTRIAVVSDLHGKEFGEDNERLLAYIRDLEPDCIAVVGDLLHEEAQLAMVPAVARGLAAHSWLPVT